MGLVLAIPGFVGSVLDPFVGVVGDTPRRRALLVAGGIGFAVSAGLSSAAVGFTTLLVALVVGNPASGAFVSLAQATLIDLDPSSRERTMARWTLAGSFGYVGGPLVVAGALAAGAGWRVPLGGLAVCAVPLIVSARSFPTPLRAETSSVRSGLVEVASALRQTAVLRWLALLESADLLLDVFQGFLALYLVDAASFDPRVAAAGVAIWTGAGLIGDWLLLVALRRLEGTSVLRATAFAALAVYPTFLLAHGAGAKLMLLAALGLLNSGWYAIPKAGLYAALPGRSGAAVAVGGVAGTVGSCVPLVLGFVASSIGLGATMWVLLLAPVAIVALVPRR